MGLGDRKQRGVDKPPGLEEVLTHTCCGWMAWRETELPEMNWAQPKASGSLGSGGEAGRSPRPAR